MQLQKMLNVMRWIPTLIGEAFYSTVVVLFLHNIFLYEAMATHESF